MRILILLLCVFYADLTWAQSHIFVLSPVQDKANLQTQISQILKQSSRLPEGENITLLAGDDGAVVAQMQSFGAKRARRFSKFTPAIKRGLKDFIARAALPDGRLAGSLHVSRLNNAKNAHIYLVGSPLFDAPSEAAFSMASGLVPSDGHLNATPLGSVFGLKGRENWLQNARIYWAFPTAKTFTHEAHAYAVERFWTLYFEKLGAQLMGFGGAINSHMNHAKSNGRALPHGFEAAENDKLSMMRLHITRIENAPESRNSNAPYIVSNLEIGARWDCACDVDLWAQTARNQTPLYYGHADSPQGQHLKDIQSAPQGSGGFESIRFHQPVNLQTLRVVVNFYGGHAPNGVRGTLRILHDGRLQTLPFHITASAGNGGAGVAAFFQNQGTLDTYSTSLNTYSLFTHTED